jgi:hypothetical protein
MGGDRPCLHQRSGESHRRKPTKQAVPSAFGACRLSATPIPRPPAFVRDASACPGGCAACCHGGARPFPDRDDNEYLLACHPRAAVAGSSPDGCPAAGSGSLVVGLSWTFAVDHSWITHSRNRAVLGGHARTARRRHSSSVGPLRSRRDSRGHVPATVRDREDEGSNPSPPTICVFEIGDFGRRLESAEHSWITISCGAMKSGRGNGDSCEAI